MNWQETLTIIVPICALLGWVYRRLDLKFDKIDQRFLIMEKKMDERFNRVEEKLQILDSRISRIEGQLAPRIWEPQIVQTKEQQ